MPARVHLAEDHVGNRRAALGAGQIGHEQSARVLGRTETERPAGDDHDDHRLPRRLERGDQRLLVRRKRRARVVAEALGVRTLADGDDDRVGRGGRRDRRCLVRGVHDVRILGLQALEHRRAGRDLVRRAHAADVVPRVVHALPAHAPPAELSRHRVGARSGHDQLRTGRQRQERVLVAEQRDRLARSPKGGVSARSDRRVRLARVDVRVVEEPQLELERQDPTH